MDPVKHRPRANPTVDARILMHPDLVPRYAHRVQRAVDRVNNLKVHDDALASFQRNIEKKLVSLAFAHQADGQPLCLHAGNSVENVEAILSVLDECVSVVIHAPLRADAHRANGLASECDLDMLMALLLVVFAPIVNYELLLAGQVWRAGVEAFQTASSAVTPVYELVMEVVDVMWYIIAEVLWLVSAVVVPVYTWAKNMATEVASLVWRGGVEARRIASAAVGAGFLWAEELAMEVVLPIVEQTRPLIRREDPLERLRDVATLCAVVIAAVVMCVVVDIYTMAINVALWLVAWMRNIDS